MWWMITGLTLRGNMWKMPLSGTRPRILPWEGDFLTNFYVSSSFFNILGLIIPGGCKILKIKIAVRGQVHDTDSNM